VSLLRYICLVIPSCLTSASLLKLRSQNGRHVCFSSNITMTESKRKTTRWVRHVTRINDANAYKIFPEGKFNSAYRESYSCRQISVTKAWWPVQNRSINPRIFNLRTGGWLVVSLTRWLLLHRGNSPYPLERKLSGSKSQSWELSDENDFGPSLKFSTTCLFFHPIV